MLQSYYSGVTGQCCNISSWGCTTAVNALRVRYIVYHFSTPADLLSVRIKRLQRVLHSIISARLILNLRKFMVEPVDDEPKDLTAVVFRELVSDPYSSNDYGSQQNREGEVIELRDLRSTRDSTSTRNSYIN